MVERNGKKYIVTNAHVVEETPGDKPLAAYSINQTRYAVRVLGADTFYDLAILQFAGQEPGPDITSLKLRTTPLRIGEQIYAIGNPLGELPYTVTQGIVSGLNRTMPNNMGKFGYVQSSAAISPGNSGGPLVDSNGEVIGINTWARMVTKEVAYSQLNFAQNAAIAVRLIDELLAGGHLRRAYLGVELVQNSSARSGFPATGRPVLAGVIPGSPAAAVLAGQENNGIERISGKPIHSIDEALSALERVHPGESVQLVLLNPKSGVSKTVTVTAGELNDDSLQTLGSYFLRQHGNLKMTATPGRVLLSAGERNPVPGVPVQRRDYHIDRQPGSHGRVLRAAPQAEPDSITVLAVGLAAQADGDFYRAATPAQLSRGLKLFAMTGLVGFVFPGKDPDTPAVRIFSLSGQEDVLRRTLLY